MKKLLSGILGCITMMLFASPVFAQTGGDLAILGGNFSFSTNTFLEGNWVRIYVTIKNNSNADLRGVVTFTDNSAGIQIGSDQSISLLAGSTDDVFVDWAPGYPGDHTVSVYIDPWIEAGDDPNNNVASKTVNVLPDTDHDGLSNDQDIDDDNDGVGDKEDVFPLDASEWVDTDGDRTGDNADEDDDNDGVLDEEDAFPLNSLESADVDEDGVGNNADTDDDNDKLSDEQELTLGTDPLKSDTDDDGVIDGDDAFPLNIEEQYDFDNDSIGDNADTDDDNDGIPDHEDSYPFNKGPHIVIEGNKNVAFLNRPHLLTAEHSYDEDGEIQTVAWMVNKERYEETTFKYSFRELGSNEIVVEITDNTGESRTEVIQVTIYDLDLYLNILLFSIIIVLAILIGLNYSSLAKKLIKYK